MKLAAIDLGSNSFRLEIARVEGERIITEGSWKETIRLAAGIDKDGNLTPEAQNRGLNALARIAEKIRDRKSTRLNSSHPSSSRMPSSA